MPVKLRHQPKIITAGDYVAVVAIRPINGIGFKSSAAL